MCYRAERGEHNQHQPRKWARDEIKQHGLVLQGSTVRHEWSAGQPVVLQPLRLCGHQHSAEYSTQLGTRTTAAVAAGSAAQLHAQLQQQTEMDSARDDVTEPEPGP